MEPKQHPPAVIELPNGYEIVVTRAFEAPIAAVFDAFTTRTRAEMAVSEGEELKVYINDLRVGGTWHHVFAGDDGRETSFRGTFLEVDRPNGSSPPGSSTTGPTQRLSSRSNCARRTGRRCSRIS